jgi:hypothetical protein
MEDWDGLMLCLNKHKENFSQSDREALVDKYFPIALNSIYQIYADLDPSSRAYFGDDEKAGKIKQMQLKLKF